MAKRRRTSGRAKRPDKREAVLNQLERDAHSYFQYETNPKNGLVHDSTQKDSPCSIAAVGFALGSHLAAAERGIISRKKALQWALAAARFFHASPQGTSPHDTGHRGFYYHFLDMRTGRRTWNSELSSIDTGLLLMGMLAAAEYFDRDAADERELRELVAELYLRVDWNWMLAGGNALRHGWRPRRGFIQYRWQGYNEAMFLYILALGSPTHPIPAESYNAWCTGFKWRHYYGQSYLYAGPLFIHQFSHVWLDLRGIQDAYMRRRGIDYFENSRRAVEVQQSYAAENPHGFRGYARHCWGFTAGDGPPEAIITIDGRRRHFLGYRARGAPNGPDDGTIAPWAAVASLPFAPEATLATVRRYQELKIGQPRYGFEATFNFTASGDRRNSQGWISPVHYGINQGPIVLMLENHRSELIWRLLRNCNPIVRGLRRAGFQGGWLEAYDSGRQ